MAALLLSCSNAEQFMEDEILPPVPMMNEDVESSTSNPVLTRSEVVALAVEKKGTYKVSENEAIQSLKDFSKSVSDSKQSDIRTKSSVLKKSAKTGKDMYYEVVFESDKGTGFSIISADERGGRLLCYSEVGSISDTSFNKNLKFCLQLIDIYIEEQMKEELDIELLTSSAKKKLVSNETIDTMAIKTRAVPAFNPNDPNWYYGRTDVNTTVAERLKFVSGSGWHQGLPFNEFLPNNPNTGGTAAVGCYMIAVAQVMSYHRRPFGNYITTAMWPNMIDNPNTSVDLKNLMRDIHVSMITNYVGRVSMSDSDKAKSFLNSNGYTVGSQAYYSYNVVWDALNYGPTIMRGDNSRGEGHAWVVDGARTTTTNYKDIYYYNYNGKIIEHTANPYTYITKYVKHDWGWGRPKDNTWIIDNVFQMPDSKDTFNFNVAITSYIR